MENTQEAAQAFRAALEIMESERFTGMLDPAIARQQAHDLSHLGEIEHRMGKTVEAEQKYRKALNLLADAVNRPNADVMDSYQTIRAGLLRNLGNLLVETDRVAAAIPIHKESVSMIGELASTFPSVAYYQAQWARSQIAYGMALDADGQPDEANTQFRTAERSFAGLADTYPQNEAFRQQQQETLKMIQRAQD